MNRLAIITLLVSILISTTGRQLETSSDVTRGTDNSKREYFLAKHGYGSGLEMVDLSIRKGFDSVRNIDDVAKFAAKVPGAIGFTAHPDFEQGMRYASAILWYTTLSLPQNSWPLYLFDETEAKKKPGDKPRSEALVAAEAKVQSKMAMAKELIDASGSRGVKLTGDFDDQQVLALAIMRLGGSFEHNGEFGTTNCGGCRILVPGGTPILCGLGVQKKKHWGCCGSTEKKSHCQFWQLFKKQNTSH
tara:strand:+ start:256 stop:993 length:738 start_codon:yes stop_codon:yes gene_type:complete